MSKSEFSHGGGFASRLRVGGILQESKVRDIHCCFWHMRDRMLTAIGSDC